MDCCWFAKRLQMVSRRFSAGLRSLQSSGRAKSWPVGLRGSLTSNAIFVFVQIMSTRLSMGDRSPSLFCPSSITRVYHDAFQPHRGATQSSYLLDRTVKLSLDGVKPVVKPSDDHDTGLPVLRTSFLIVSHTSQWKDP